MPKRKVAKSTKPKKKKVNKKTSAAFALLVLAAVVVFLWSNGENLVNSKPAVQLGGSFTLTDQNGHTRTDQEFLGKNQIIFFGFTHCPDICPVALSVMTEALNQLGDDAKEFQPIFITIDPARDTPQAMKEYLSNFHPSFVGLTGEDAKLKELESKYKVYTQKSENADEPDGYTMYHSGLIYVMDKKGHFVSHFSNKDNAEDMVVFLKNLI